MNYRKFSKIALLVAIAIFVISASLFIFGFSDKNSLKKITIQCAVDCNQNSPVQVDILFIKNEDIAQVLVGFNSTTWFTEKQLFMSQYRHQISDVNLEIVPVSIIEEVLLPEDSGLAVRVLLFARYVNVEGQNVADISNYDELEIRFEKVSYTLSELRK